MQTTSYFASRFRQMLPVVVDLETSGLNPEAHAILEMAMMSLTINEEGLLMPDELTHYHVDAFIGAELDKEALTINRIDPYSPLRYAIPEEQALHFLFRKVNQLLKKHQCKRAFLVGHNAWFDLAFLRAAMARSAIHASPFHSFTTLDTATLSAALLGETVLAKAARAAKISFNVDKTHSLFRIFYTKWFSCRYF